MPEGANNADSNFIPIGYVRRAHGIRGDVLVRGLVSDGPDRFVTGASLLLEGGESSFSVESARPKDEDFILHLAGVDDRSAAEALVGSRFVVPRAQRRALQPDEWWAEDVVGCAVLDSEGRVLGYVVDVVVGAAQDRLVVEQPSSKVFEVPLVDALVPTVDLDAKQIIVSLPSGLADGIEAIDDDG